MIIGAKSDFLWTDPHRLRLKPWSNHLNKRIWWQALGWFVAVCLAWATPGLADFSVSYTVTEAKLTLFNQAQTSPFESVSCRLLIRGDRVRFEATDHWGRSHAWLADRKSGDVWRLYPETRDYTRHKGGWPCDDLASHVAYALNYYLRAARIDDLTVTDGGSGVWDGQPAQKALLAFEARLFGLPQAVAVGGTVYFPADENEAFQGGAAQAYCGKAPAAAAWQEALIRHTGLAADEARILAERLGLPLALDLRTDLGMGSASLVLSATAVSVAPVPTEQFQVPTDYVERPPNTDSR
jgi:hypothetical protein